MAYPKTYEGVLKLIKDHDKKAKIVDLGCGRGHIVKELRKLGFTDIAYCDIKDNFDGKVKITDLNEPIAFEDNTFDMIISTELIEHLENKYSFLREVKRIARNGCIFIFSTPNTSNLPNRIKYLFNGRFIEFNRNEMPEHKNPFFMWELPMEFTIEKITYNRGFIPILRLPFIKSKLFGQTLIIKCKIKK